jgi:outer membrane protein assembly factor BamB
MRAPGKSSGVVPTFRSASRARPAAFAPPALRRASPKLARCASERRGEGLHHSRLLLLPAVAASLCIVVSAQTPPAANWPQFRGNARLTGVAPAPPAETLQLKWTYEAGESIESSAAIADGAVYVGSSKGELIAIDLETGTLRWKYATGEAGFIGESSPAVTADTVFIGDLAGVLHAVAVADGRRLWAFKADDEIRSSPVVVNDLVLIGSYDTYLYALEQKTGRVRWKLQTDGPVHATPAVHNGVIYVGGCDEQFRAVRVSDGKTLFALPIGSNMGASSAIEGERAYVGTYGADVFAIDLRARKVAWSYRDPDREFPYYSSPAIADGRVIIGGRDKAVHALDAASGRSAWKFVTRARVDSSPVVAGGRVFVGSSDGKLYVLDAASGRKRWEFEAGDAITASPAIAAGRVVVGATDGRIYCFG